MNNIKVPIKDNSYQIIIGSNILSELVNFLNHKKYSKIIVIIDENVFNHHSHKLISKIGNVDFIVIESGENSKSFTNFEDLTSKILSKNIDRKTLLIAFGGGVVGDLTGFCASVLLRGIDFIQIPTTLLAMVDSSVGGKTAINSIYGKNLIGTFYQPKLVLCDIDFLETLPLRDFRSGYAEVVKYGIAYDIKFFDFLQQNLIKIFAKNAETLINIITRSCEIKAEIVSLDEKENNIRALLNFGHTFGHAFEAETGYSSEILHGEAVAIGIVMASQMSVDLGLLANENFLTIINHLQLSKFEIDPKKIRSNWSKENLIKHLFKDKKTENNQLTFILLREIGKAEIHKKIAPENINEILKKFLD